MEKLEACVKLPRLLHVLAVLGGGSRGGGGGRDRGKVGSNWMEVVSDMMERVL